MKTAETILTDEQINKAWGNANFGDISKRQVIVDALEHFAKGYKPGSTAQAIVKELGLVEREYLTDKGYEYLIASYQPAALQSHPAEELEEQINTEFRMIISHALLGYNDNVNRDDWELIFTECTKYALKLIQSYPSPTSEKPGGWQLCPKCLGDGNLMRYNSPPMSTNANVVCDVCNGMKIIPFSSPSEREGGEWIAADVDFNSPEMKEKIKLVQKECDEIMKGAEVDTSKLHFKFR